MNIRSDLYLMEILGVRQTEKDRAQKAYKLFLSKAKKPYPASYPTMRRWFGLDEFSVLKREQAYRIAFSLELSLEDLNNLLTMGIQEPGVQYHDYQEIIFAYGLCNHLSYEEAISMIDAFEGHFDNIISLTRTHNTIQMMHQFEINQGLSREEFIQWMVLNGSNFKGYSMTTLDYLNKLKDLIIGYIRNDAQEQMDMLLRETDFDTWLKKRVVPCKTQNEAVQKYVLRCRRQKNSGISHDLLNVINELNNLSKPDNNFNTSMLSEVYGYDTLPAYVPAMTQKHLSDLLNVPTQKDREFKAGIAENILKKLQGNSPCPQWITDFIFDYTRGRVTADTVTKAQDWVQSFRKEHHRRCTLIQRTDFLPLILYVAQKRYSDSINQKKKEYHSQDAKTFFVNMANDIFAACGMEKVNEQYPFDAMVLSCFQPEEMYSFNEIVESAAGISI